MLPSALSWACSMIPPPGGFHHPGFVVTAGLFEYVIIAPELKQSSVPIVELRLVIVQASSQYAGVWSPYFLRLERPLLLARPGRLRPRSLPQPRGAASPHTQKHSQGCVRLLSFPLRSLLPGPSVSPWRVRSTSLPSARRWVPQVASYSRPRR